MKIRQARTGSAIALACAAGLFAAGAHAQTLDSNATGIHDGYYYTFWKDSGPASMTLHPGGRYSSQWTSGTNNWVGGKGWNPGGARVVNYSGYYGVNNSQNSYLALYGWTRNPLIEYYVIESYGSYNPASCAGGVDYGSFQSDGATYSVRRCQRVNAPSIEGNNSTFYQYFSVRQPKKGFGNISGTITVANHFNYWASRGLTLGSHDYMVLATEGYRSQGSSDITVSDAGQRRRRNGSQPLQPGTLAAPASSPRAIAPALRQSQAPAAPASVAEPAPAPAVAGPANRASATSTSAVAALWTRLREWLATRSDTTEPLPERD